MPMKHRHRARRLAMQALCCLDVQGESACNAALSFIHESDETPEAIDYAVHLLEGAWANRAAGDALLAQRSRHWDVKRMAVVDRGILRLAVWELTVGLTPLAVVISEALSLAEEFSTAESPRFINGILEAIARARPETRAPASDDTERT